MSATKNNNVDGSFYNMLNKYNLASVTLPSGTNATSNASASPLFFPRAGDITSRADVQVANSYYVGNYSSYWSSTINSGTNAYNLFFNDTNVYPSRDDNRYYGFPVRCLVN